MIYPERR